MARVSILMGIYNCADTLDEAIDSIMKQTYTDWKLILCDDGSVDDTYAIAKRYVEQYPDKFLLLKNEKNLGLNATLNRCLEVADSEFIARMDGDDISLPERFATEVAFLDAHPEYAIVSSGMQYFDQEGVFRVGKGRGEPMRESFAHGTPFCHAPCMVRKEAYDRVGGYSVSDKLLRVEDWHLWIKMYAAGYR
ncbi:MAG: glycosyltransferase, partial [Faecalimonas sp.]|nr:glycosyltransferase [Faecalimonas sp.]